jgi:acetyl esterase/lipase
MSGTSPIAKDFANVLTARQLVLANAVAVPAADYGRAQSAHWINNFSADIPAAMHRQGDARIFTPTEIRDPREIFYLHGGGLVHYSTEVFASFLAALSVNTARVIRAFDYPKAPETPLDRIVEHLVQQLATALAATATSSAPELMGDSVGGLLALYFCQRSFAGQFARLHLLYPVLALHQNFSLYATYSKGLLLDADTMAWFARHWTPWCQAQQFDPLSPDFVFANLPPCEVHSAGHDVLRDEAAAFFASASQRNGPVRHHSHADLPHDFCLYSRKLESAQHGVARIAATLLVSPTF